MGLAFAVVQWFFFASLAVAWGASAVWVWRDARVRCRGRRRTVGFVLAALPLAGPVLYAALRPCDTELERRERRAYRALLEDELDPGPRCLACRTQLDESFRCCPGCGLELRRPCRDCGAPLDLTWAACPHCASSTPAPVPVPLRLTA